MPRGRRAPALPRSARSSRSCRSAIARARPRAGAKPRTASAPATRAKSSRFFRVRSASAGGKFQRVLVYALAHCRTVIAILALSLACSALAVLQPWPLKLLVDFGIGGAPLPDALASVFALAGIEATPF